TSQLTLCPAPLSFIMLPPPPTSTLLPYTTLFRSQQALAALAELFDGSTNETNVHKVALETPDLASLLAVWLEELVFLADTTSWRSEEHTSELQSRGHLVCRLLLVKTN